jgi:hypothetical protein
MCEHPESKVKIELDKNEALFIALVDRLKELVISADKAVNEFNEFLDEEEKSDEKGKELLQNVVATQTLILSLARGYGLMKNAMDQSEKNTTRVMDKLCEEYDLPPLHDLLNGRGCKKEKKWWQL